jgi:hypothetical protein
MVRSHVRIGSLLAAFVVAVTSVQATLTLTQDKPGNIFYTTETVTLPVAGTGKRIDWVITDFFGAVVKTGGASFSGGRTVIQPALGRTGYFAVAISEKNGTGVISSKSTTFAVVTPIDVSAMADSRFGVQTHFAQYSAAETDIVPVLARAGIAQVRDEQYWGNIETVKGAFTYPSTFTNYMGALAAQSLNPLITLDWGNPFYDYDAGTFTGPYTQAGRNGYTNYALNLLGRYGNQIKQVEIWNEYNAGTFIQGPAAADKDYYYAAMLKDVYQAIKSVRPDVSVLAGATTPVAHGFLRDIFAQGALSYCDAISVHPYIAAESADLEVSELRNLIRQYNNNQEKPIWATEFSLEVNSAAAQPEEARHVVRIATQLLNQNVARMYYYLGGDDSNFPYRGLVSSSSAALGKYAPHQAYVAYAVFIRQLYGWTGVGRMGGTRPGTYAYAFTNGTAQRYVLWATTPTTVYLDSPAATLTAMDLMGTATTLPVTGGRVALQLGANPLYLTGAVNAVTDASNRVVADSVADYSKGQGVNGWSYGYADLPSAAAYSTGSFQTMHWDIWATDNYRWIGSGIYNFLTSNQAHPSGSWAIRRWTSTVAGLVDIAGDLNRPSANGDGTRLRLFVDGVERLNQFIAPAASLSYLVPNVPVGVGSQVDLAIVQEANNADDATVATMRVTRVQSSPITLVQGSLTDYSTQSGTSSGASVGISGTSLTLTGNIWRKHPFSYNVTPSTMLEFTVNATNVGEMLGIGLDNDDDYTNRNTLFKIAGAESNGSVIPVSQVYSVDKKAVTYVIPIGAYYTGAMNYLTFVGDDDARKAVSATFSNIRIYEGL